MNGMESMGKWLVIAGGTLALVGALIWLFSKVEFLGNLPGDIRIERPGFSCMIPLASSILLSIVLTVILNIVVRLFKR